MRLKTIVLGILLLILILTFPFATEYYSRITIHNFVANNMYGVEVKFTEFEDNVILIVNTATECRYTPQFLGLQKLYDTYKNRGFTVIAFPSDSFNQEQRSTREIVDYCTDEFLVNFPIFEKIDVKGVYQASIYKYLTEKETNRDFSGPIQWNFEKFIIGKNGTVRARFPSDTPPESRLVVTAIEEALADRGVLQHYITSSNR